MTVICQYQAGNHGDDGQMGEHDWSDWRISVLIISERHVEYCLVVELRKIFPIELVHPFGARKVIQACC